jgi:hypothetical protein
MAIRVMLDSDVIGDLDGHCELVATYSDLATDYEALQDQFPHSVVVLIDRGLGDPTGRASVADVQTGAMTVDQFPAWYDRKHKAGVRYLTAYCNRSTLAALDAVLGNRKPYRWLATLDGTCHIDGFQPLHGPAAVQILGANSVGVHCDLSLVMEDGWHPTPITVPVTKFTAAQTARDEPVNTTESGST